MDTKKVAISNIVNGLRELHGKDIKVFVHNKTSADDLDKIFGALTAATDIKPFDNGECRILSMTDSAVAYRSGNNIYVIPATVRAVIDNNDKKLRFFFDYPCKMVESDLELY